MPPQIKVSTPLLHQEACQCAVTAAVGVNDFRMSDFAVRSFIKLELLGVTEMLKNLTVFIGNCNFHDGISFAIFAWIFLCWLSASGSSGRSGLPPVLRRCGSFPR